MKLLASTAAALALLLAGCGDDDADTESSAQGGEEAAIEVEAPEEGATVSSPVTVSGTASVFEATVGLRVLDATGKEIGRGFATATAGAPERGDFSGEVEFAVDEAQEGTVEAYSPEVASEGEGTVGKPASVEVPVQLEP